MYETVQQPAEIGKVVEHTSNTYGVGGMFTEDSVVFRDDGTPRFNRLSVREAFLNVLRLQTYSICRSETEELRYRLHLIR